MLKQQVAKWAIVACATMALGAYAYDADTAYTVPAGTTVTVTDADIASFNSLASVTFGDAAATLVFDTATAPTVSILGKGTIRKTSTANWTLDTDQSGFTGTWDFEAGETSLDVKCALGDENSTSNVYVRSGATLTLNSGGKFRFASRPLHLAGAGVANRGAIRVKEQTASSNMLKTTILDDDADIVFDGTAYLFHNATGGNATSLALGTHTLTLRVSTSSHFLYMMNGKIEGPGRIVSTNVTGGTSFVGGLSLRGAKLLDPSVEVVMHDRTSMSIYNHSPTNYFAKLTVEGERCRMYHTHQSQSTAGLCTTNFSHDLWAGPVHLKNATSKLEMGCKERADDPIVIPYKTGILGPVYGPGSLSFGTMNDYSQGICALTCPTNSYTGSTTLRGTYGATLYVPYSNSIPVYANFTSDTPLTLKPNGEEYGWSGASIARFAESATVNVTYPNVRVYVDASALPESTLTFDGAEIADGLSSDWIDGISGIEGTTLVFASPLGRPINPQAASNSVVKLTGTDTLYVTNPVPKKDTPLSSGEVVFDGAKDIRFLPTKYFCMSAAHGARRYSFKDSVSTRPLNTEDSNANNIGDDAFTLGYRNGSYVASGDMFIGAGTVITSKLMTGSTDYTYGRIVQTGGVFATLSGFTDTYCNSTLGIGTGSQSYYELVDGSFTSVGSLLLARNGSAVFRQKGGSFAIVEHPNSVGVANAVAWLSLSYGPNSRSHFIAEGGTADFASTILVGRNPGYRAAFTVAGDAAVTVNANFAYGYNSGITCLNLNGGTYKVSGLNSRFKVNQYPAKGFYPETYVNANGGTLAANASSTTLLGPPQISGPDSGEGYPLTRIALYGKGLTIDIRTRNCTGYGILTPATGKGVASIPLETPIKGLLVSPFVDIDGDGHGATAVVDIDRETGDATGFTVTSAGFDYTWAKAKIFCGPDSTTNDYMTIDCVLADNGPDGGLALKGTTGIFTLTATNTYHGATTLAGGTLKMGCDWAIPVDSTIVLSGGKLDMNGHTLEGGGTLPKNWAVDLDRVRAGGTVTNDWSLAFPSGATFSLLNADELTDADANLRTLLYVNGTVSGAPAIGGVDNPMWKVQWSGNRLAMKKITGAVFSVR